MVTYCSAHEGDPLLPEGVIASLSKVATPDGCLTFERFCAGIKIARLRQEASQRKRVQINKENQELMNKVTKIF